MARWRMCIRSVDVRVVRCIGTYLPMRLAGRAHRQRRTGSRQRRGRGSLPHGMMPATIAVCFVLLDGVSSAVPGASIKNEALPLKRSVFWKDTVIRIKDTVITTVGRDNYYCTLPSACWSCVAYRGVHGDGRFLRRGGRGPLFRRYTARARLPPLQPLSATATSSRKIF